MKVHVFEDSGKMALTAGRLAAEAIKQAIQGNGSANIILATGASQFGVLEALVQAPGIDWTKVTMFHLDEYIGLDVSHPASFRHYLRERFIDKVGSLRAVHFVEGDAVDPRQECQRLGEVIKAHPVDVALIGIGENGHLAFNDPPADFETEEPYIVVTMDDRCRRQQHDEGWFKSLEEVPARAISMSIRQILKSKRIICSVPEARKAAAVREALEGKVRSLCPASILQLHPNCTVYLDKASASLLSATGKEKWLS